MAHEIAHVLCRHGVQQLQFTLFLVACFYAFMTASGIDISAFWGKILFFSIRMLLQLPMSRKFELEADEIAIYLLKFAGYDPYALVTLLEKLGQANSQIENLIPEILSTHPLTNNRIEQLQRNLDKINQLLPP